MTVVLFSKTAAGPTFGPYQIDDVVDINAGDLAKMTGPTEPNAIGKPAAAALPASDPRYGKPTKKGT